MCEHGPFNCDLLIQEEVKRLINDFNIKNVIETGTFLGHSTEFLSNYVDKVYTIEMAEVYYNKAVNRFMGNDKIELYFGDTREKLPIICEKLETDSTPLFFLDAHGGCDPKCPLDVELEIISKKFKDNCVIIIDDFRVPNRDFYNDGFTIQQFNRYIDLCYSRGNALKYFNHTFKYDPNTPLKNANKGSGRLFVLPKDKINNINKYVFKQGQYYYSNIKL